jgi:hypothetical protein
MPDLSIESFWHCTSAENWQTQVQGKTGTYTVTFDRHSHLNQAVQLDYSCTCPAYKFGKGKPCKHIEAAKKSHCGWMEFADGGEVKHDANGKPVCPNCGQPVAAMRHAV